MPYWPPPTPAEGEDAAFVSRKRYMALIEAAVGPVPGGLTAEVVREMLNLRGPAREETVHEWARRLASGENPECDHEWVSVANKAVVSGEMCRKCRAIRASEPPTPGVPSDAS